MTNFFDNMKREIVKNIAFIVDESQKMVGSSEIDAVIISLEDKVKKEIETVSYDLRFTLHYNCEVRENMPTLTRDNILCCVIGGMSLDRYRVYKYQLWSIFGKKRKIAVVLLDEIDADVLDEVIQYTFDKIVFVKNYSQFVHKTVDKLIEILKLEKNSVQFTFTTPENKFAMPNARPMQPVAPPPSMPSPSMPSPSMTIPQPTQVSQPVPVPRPIQVPQPVPPQTVIPSYIESAPKPKMEFDSDRFGETTVLTSDCTSTPIQENNRNYDVEVSQVQFSAIIPKKFIKGAYSMIDIAVYEELYDCVIDNIISNADSEVKEVTGSAQEVRVGTNIKICLSSPDIELEECEETQKWKGRYLVYSFPVEIPSNYEKKQALFIATVYFNDLIATKLKFIANCTSLREQKLQVMREDVLKAFISYASQDRSRVATIIQGMRKARPDMDIFFDVESLRSGENWQTALRSEIESRDVLFLCWSNYAKDSEWVDKEWRYALANKGLEAIEPIPLVSPAECPPPEELKSKHFNDRSLLYGL